MSPSVRPFPRLSLTLLAIALALPGCATPDWSARMGRATLAIADRRYDEAERDLLQAIEQVRNDPPGDVRLGLAQASLARVYLDRDELEAAARMIETSLRTLSANLPADHPQLAAALETSAWVYALQGDTVRAEERLQRALYTHERAAPSDPNRILRALLRLGSLQIHSHRYEQAQVLFGRALDLAEGQFSIGDSRRAEALSGLGMIERRMGHSRRAEEMLREAARILDEAQGDVAHLLARTLEERSLTLHGLGDAETAEGVAERAARIRLGLPAPPPLELADQKDRLAALAEATGDLARATQGWKEALALTEQRFGPDHPHVADLLARLGAMAHQAGDLDAASLHLTRALDILERSQAIDRSSSLPTLVSASRLFIDVGRVDDADTRLRQILSIARRDRRLERTSFGDAVSSLASRFEALGRREPAQDLLRVYARALEEGPDVEPEFAAEVRLQLAGIYSRDDRRNHAIAQLRRAIRLLERGYGRDDARLEPLRARLMALRGPSPSGAPPAPAEGRELPGPADDGSG